MFQKGLLFLVMWSGLVAFTISSNPLFLGFLFLFPWLQSEEISLQLVPVKTKKNEDQ